MKPIDQPLLFIAAGGTGGHIFPAQALADYILKDGWRVKVFTDSRGIKYASKFHEKIDVVAIPSSTFSRKNLIKKINVIFKLFLGTCLAIFHIIKDRPKVVAGFGGYPAFPIMLAATLLRVPLLIHEQNGILGRVNQFFVRRSTIVACGVWPTKLPKGVKAFDCGNPVRQSIMKLKNSPYIPPGDYPVSIVILGGSQGARILSDVVPTALSLLPDNIIKNIQVSHQARKEDKSRVNDFYCNSGINADVQDFFSDIPKRLNEAQLIISRAGASTIAEISIIGRPSILIPLKAAIRDEQTANALPLVSVDAAILLTEDKLTALELRNVIHKFILNPKRCSQMAKLAHDNCKGNATKNLTELVISLAEKNNLGST